MNPLFIIIIIFVAFISINIIYRQHKRRKKENQVNVDETEYKRRIGKRKSVLGTTPDITDFVTKHNSPIDYRERATEKEDYSDWGE